MQDDYLIYYNSIFNKESYLKTIKILESFELSSNDIISLLQGHSLYRTMCKNSRFYYLMEVKVTYDGLYEVFVSGRSYHHYTQEQSLYLNSEDYDRANKRNGRSILLKIEHFIEDADILKNIVNELNKVENFLVEAFGVYRPIRGKYTQFGALGIQLRCQTNDFTECPTIAQITKSIVGDSCVSIYNITGVRCMIRNSDFIISYPVTSSGIIVEKKNNATLEKVQEILQQITPAIDITSITEGNRAWKIIFSSYYCNPTAISELFWSNKIEAKVYGKSDHDSFVKDDLGPCKWRVVSHKSSSMHDEENVMRGIAEGYGDYYGY